MNRKLRSLVIAAGVILGSLLPTADFPHSAAAESIRQQRHSMTPVPASQTIGALQLGANAPQVACTLKWQGSASFIESNSIAGGYKLAAFQDPGADGCPGPYPFGVTNIFWTVYFRFDVPVQVQLVLYHDIGTGACPMPGGILHTGPTYVVNPPAAGPWVIRMSLTDTVCVNGPFFAGIRIVSNIDTGLVDILIDTNTPQSCRTFRDTGAGWRDLVVDEGFLHNMQIWSSGLDPSQNGCPSNQCPVNLSAVPDPVNAIVGTQATTTVSASDPDGGGPLRYYLMSGPGSVDSVTGEWTYTPSCDDVPGFTVTVEASDRGPGGCPLSDETIQVNVAPTPVSMSGCASVNAHWGDVASLQLSANGGCPPISFNILNGPGNVSPAGLWTFQSDCGDVGTTQVQITVTDSEGQADTCMLMLNVENTAPTCVSFGPISAPPGQLTQIPLGPMNQADGDALQYVMVSGPAWGGINGTNWVATRTMGDPADYTVCFTVSDFCATSSQCCFLVTESCQCECHADPECDGATNVVDVVLTVNRAFRGSPAITFCPAFSAIDGRTDVDCTGSTDLLDVVKVIDVAFRGADPATKFCDPCGP